MTMTDPIADLLTRLRNGFESKHVKVDVPASKVKLEIVRILQEEGYIESFKVSEDSRQGTISVFLRYGSEREPAITEVRKVSTPGCRVYYRKDQIPDVLNGLGINILSTSQGLMTGQKARKAGIGGEILCTIY